MRILRSFSEEQKEINNIYSDKYFKLFPKIFNHYFKEDVNDILENLIIWYGNNKDMLGDEINLPFEVLFKICENVANNSLYETLEKLNEYEVQIAELFESAILEIFKIIHLKVPMNNTLLLR